MKIVIVNGAPGSGKTTFEDECKTILGSFCRSRSTIDKVKEIAKICGWNGKKDLNSRKFLSDLKDLLNNFNDLPTKDIIEFKRQWEDELASYGLTSDKCLLFIDDREPDHIDKLKKELNAVTILVIRDIVINEKTSNHADSEVLNYNYDLIIDNNSSIEELHESAKTFINWIFSEN